MKIIGNNSQGTYEYLSFFELMDKLMELDPTWVEDLLNTETQTFFNGVALDLQVKREVLGMGIEPTSEFPKANNTENRDLILANYHQYQENLVKRFAEGAKYNNADVKDPTLQAIFNKVTSQKTM